MTAKNPMSDVCRFYFRKKERERGEGKRSSFCSFYCSKMAPTSTATATATATFEAEIRQCFDVLDEERTGTITPHALTTLLRSTLGTRRWSRDEIMTELDAARQRRRHRRSRSGQGDDSGPDDDDNDYSNGRIDVELALDVCRHASNGSNGSTASTKAANLQQTFRLFDIDDKGIITLDNLRKVADEIYGSETNTESSSSSRKSSIDDDLLKSMIETFDGDLTDGISFEEFYRIMDR